MSTRRAAVEKHCQNSNQFACWRQHSTCQCIGEPMMVKFSLLLNQWVMDSLIQACSSNIPCWHSDANFPPQAWHNTLDFKIISNSMPIFENPQPVPNECWKSALELPLQVVRSRTAPQCSHFLIQCYLIQQAPLAAFVLFKVRLALEGGRAGITGPNGHNCQEMLQ